MKILNILITWIFLDLIEEFKSGINENSINNSKRINFSIFENFVNNEISELIQKYNDICQEKWKIKSFKGFKIFSLMKLL